MFLRIQGQDKQGPIELEIQIENQFDPAGTWLKGNLHCHPSGTDPEALCREYRSRGFDFLASTDYSFVSRTKLPVSVQGLITLNGFEIVAYDLAHLTCIGINEGPTSLDGTFADVSTFLKDLGEQGGLAIVSHPYFSGLDAEEIRSLAHAGLVGIEVSNRLCWKINGKERSDQIFHQLLDKGVFLAAVGCDDWIADKADDILGQNWTGVLADSRSTQAILQAIRAGRTYASEGPELHSIHFAQSGHIHVQSSPCLACHFMSSGLGARTALAQGLAENFQLDLAKDGYRLKDWLCICLEDATGRRAWSSAIRLHNKVNKRY